MWDAANCGMRIDAHGYDGIEKRLHNTVALPEARIAGNGDGPVDSDYDVRPPLMGDAVPPAELRPHGRDERSRGSCRRWVRVQDDRKWIRRRRQALC